MIISSNEVEYLLNVSHSKCENNIIQEGVKLKSWTKPRQVASIRRYILRLYYYALLPSVKF